jgi:hypothetical protein
MFNHNRYLVLPLCMLVLTSVCASSAAAEDEAAPLEPFWLKPQLQLGMEFRPGDTIISVPGKSGTTWSMNIFHQLRSGGDPELVDVYAEVPWIEFKERPNQTDEELYERWRNMPMDVPRGFKTHSPVDGPFLQYRDDLKYIVVFRNPEEALVSFLPFLKGHRDELWEYWKAEPVRDGFLGAPDITFPEWFETKVLPFSPAPGIPAPPGGLLTVFFLSFINSWWPHRNKPNVQFFHFSEMKKDHEGTVRKFANHLGFNPTEEQWPNILEYTSFPWMKAHGSKFEAATVCPMPLMKSGSMVRKGASGKAAEDGMTPEISKQIHDFAEQLVPDPAARKWMFEGGPLPPDEAHTEL